MERLTGNRIELSAFLAAGRGYCACANRLARAHRGATRAQRLPASSANAYASCVDTWFEHPDASMSLVAPLELLCFSQDQALRIPYQPAGLPQTAEFP